MLWLNERCWGIGAEANGSVCFCRCFSGQPVLDLDYAEDSNAETDMNVVMTENGGFIELQGTGEDGEFTHDQLSAMVALAEAGIKQLLAIQQASLA